MTQSTELHLAESLMALAALGKKANALDRCKTLGEGKAAYLEIYPDTKQGGARGNQHSKNVIRLKAVPPFSAYAAQKTGFSVRSIMLDVSIWQGLSPDSRTRLSGTALSAKQRELKALSKQPPDRQEMALDRILSGTAATVAEALNLTPPQPKQPDLSRVSNRDLIAELWARETCPKGGRNGKSA